MWWLWFWFGWDSDGWSFYCWLVWIGFGGYVVGVEKDWLDWLLVLVWFGWWCGWWFLVYWVLVVDGGWWVCWVVYWYVGKFGCRFLMVFGCSVGRWVCVVCWVWGRVGCGVVFVWRFILVLVVLVIWFWFCGIGLLVLLLLGSRRCWWWWRFWMGCSWWCWWCGWCWLGLWLWWCLLVLCCVVWRLFYCCRLVVSGVVLRVVWCGGILLCGLCLWFWLFWFCCVVMCGWSWWWFWLCRLWCLVWSLGRCRIRLSWVMVRWSCCVLCWIVLDCSRWGRVVLVLVCCGICRCSIILGVRFSCFVGCVVLLVGLLVWGLVLERLVVVVGLFMCCLCRVVGCFGWFGSWIF